MAVPIVIQTVKFASVAGSISITGTVAGGSPITIVFSPDLFIGLTTAEMQILCAIKLAEASGSDVLIASLTGTVNL
jgi:hypothetical protein